MSPQTNQPSTTQTAPPVDSTTSRPRLRRRLLAGSAAIALSGAIVGSGGTMAALAVSAAHQPVAATPTPASPVARLASVESPAIGSSATGSATGPITAAVDTSRDVVVSAAARVSPAVVTIVTSSSTPTSLDQGQGTADPGTGSVGRSQFGLPDGQTPIGLGSGVIFDSNGWILTNRHVVADGGTLTVQLADGRSFPAKVYGTDTLTDLAIVKIDAAGLPSATLADSSALAIGQTVIAVGDPLGEYPGTVTTGVVSGVGRSLQDTDINLDDLIQTDAAINPGNSGGPLVDENGDVVGIDTAMAVQAQGIGFAIPINLARPLAEQALAGKALSRPWLGIQYQPLDAGIATRNGLGVTEGAWITSGGNGTAVEQGGPADSAGLREGDVITAVDGTSVSVNHPLIELVGQHEPGDSVTLTVRRGTSDQTVSVKLTQRTTTQTPAPTTPTVPTP
jgi:S1-C subfamily serine protease